MRPINARLQAVLRSGEPLAVRDGRFFIRFRYEFHQNQMRAGVDDLNKGLSQVFGRPMEAVILGAEDPLPPQEVSSSDASAADEASSDHASSETSSPLKDHPVVRRAVDKWGGEVQ
jgi:hypothetical protein